MDEVIHFEDETGLLVSNVRFHDWRQTIDPQNIDAINIVTKRVWNCLSVSINEGVQIGSQYFQLQVLSALGKRLVWISVDSTDQRSILLLRGIVLALTKVIQSRKADVLQAVSSTTRPSESRTQPTPVFHRNISCQSLPREFLKMERIALQLLQNPGDKLSDLYGRFLEAVGAQVLREDARPIAKKLVYEFHRRHGSRHYPLGLYSPGRHVSLDELFRPLEASERKEFADYNAW
jgi:hypothetical protein